MDTNTLQAMQPILTVAQAREHLRLLQLGAPTSAKGADHAYSKTLASRHGVTAALVLKYLAFCILKSRKLDPEGRQMTVKSLKDIADRYPYLSESTIHDALRKLPDDQLIRTRSFSRKTGAHSTAYAFGPGLATAANDQLVYFSAKIAEEHGVSAATVLHRMQHEIRLKRRDHIGYRFHPVSPKDMATRIGLSRATVSRALQVLVEKGKIGENTSPQGRRKEYEVLDHQPGPAQTAAAGSQNRK